MVSFPSLNAVSLPHLAELGLYGGSELSIADGKKPCTEYRAFHLSGAWQLMNFVHPPGRCCATFRLRLSHSLRVTNWQNTVKEKAPCLRTGPCLLFGAWQFPTLAWGDPTLPSALRRFTSEFGMGSGGTTALVPPGIFCSLTVALSRNH